MIQESTVHKQSNNHIKIQKVIRKINILMVSRYLKKYNIGVETIPTIYTET